MAKLIVWQRDMVNGKPSPLEAIEIRDVRPDGVVGFARLVGGGWSSNWHYVSKQAALESMRRDAATENAHHQEWAKRMQSSGILATA